MAFECGNEACLVVNPGLYMMTDGGMDGHIYSTLSMIPCICVY